MMNKLDRFKYLTAAKKLGIITEEEQIELDALLTEVPAFSALKERMEERRELSQISQAYAKRKRNITFGDLIAQPQRSGRSPLRILKYAAVILFPLMFATYLFTNIGRDEVVSEGIEPIAFEATLHTIDGEQSLSVPASSSYIASGRDRSKAHRSVVDDEPSHVLSTNERHEFRVTLEDGTEIHLNYDSELHFPRHFGPKSRNVYIRGEAYVKVAKDARPFIISTDGGRVKQYGTSFNVKANRNGSTEVVLVEGRVGVTPKGGAEVDEAFLRPGQMALFSHDNKQVVIEEVDVTPYIAWDEGRINFDDMPLSRIMDIVGRWYGVSVKYTNPEIANVRFSGDLDRNSSSLRALLSAISDVTGLSVKVEGKQIIISSDN